MATNGGIKRKSSELDEQFDFPIPENWKLGQKQKVLGCDFIIHKPLRDIEDQPKIVEFEIKDQEQVWGFGVNTRFRIKGKFQYSTAPTADDPAGPWTGMPKATSSKLLVAPNFIEKIITGIDIFHGNNKINASNEISEVASYVNTWKYAFMDKKQKQLLCPEPCHPGNGVPVSSGDDGWTMTAESEWRKYADTIFDGENSFSFSWAPIDVPPFFQGTNYLEPGQPQKIVPFPIMDRVLIRLKFTEHWDNIFKKTAADTDRYRFIITDIVLVGEHLRLSKPFTQNLLNRKSFHYPGVTRINKFELIPYHCTSFLSRFQDIYLPEGIFVFAVKKEVLSGLDDMTNFDKVVFQPHKIAKCSFKFDREYFFTEEPNISMIGDATIEHKLFYDYLLSAPFDLNLDREKITLKQIKDGWKDSAYPHVYINLTNFGDKSRIIPTLNDGSILQKSADLELLFSFEAGGAPDGLAYIIYLYYTDNALTLDLKTKKNPVFTSPYVKLI